VTGLAQIRDMIRRETGIALPPARDAAIVAAVDRAAPGLGPAAFLRAAGNPHGGRGLVNRLIDEVTVQETAFVRDRHQLDAIDWPGRWRAARAAGPGPIRVWSAACASGEEAYTLALLAAEAFEPDPFNPAPFDPGPVSPQPPPVDVLGTDISGAALAAAEAGRYADRAVRGLDPWLRQRYLDRQADGSYLVGERLRSMVRLRRHNLARDPIPPPGEAGFDLVVCRNVLIYLEQGIVGPVIESMRRSLRPGGELVLGAADALQRDDGGPPASAGRDTPGPGQPPGPAPPRPRQPPRRSPPEPKPAEHPATREQRLAAALSAAGRGDRARAQDLVAALLSDDPFDADAHFIGGLVSLEAGRPAGAVTALRRALCADASFGLAAFTLGRAYDTLGDGAAARRCYEMALRTLDPEDDRHGPMLQQVDVGDVAGACRARLAGGNRPEGSHVL
jgi:chemotaxis methyl-accepting protein methylase